MRNLGIMLVVCLAVAGTVSANYNHLWTGAVDSNWANAGNWTVTLVDPNTTPLTQVGPPPAADNIWDPGFSYVPGTTLITYDWATLSNGTMVIGNGVNAEGPQFNGPAYDPNSSSTLTIEEGGTFYPCFARAGYQGNSGAIIQNGGLMKTVWVWNQPRSSSSTTVMSYTMNAGTAEFGEFALNDNAAPGLNTTLYLAPGVTFKEMGSSNYYDLYPDPNNYRYKPYEVRRAKLQGYLDNGLITTAPGCTLQLVRLVGQGYAGIDAIQIAVIPPANTAPVVSAGTDQTMSLPAAAVLDGTVTDDGNPNPPAALTYTWSKFSGPGTVTFGTGSAPDTNASFSTNGTYVLRLTASDSALSASDDVQVIVLKDLRADFNNDGFVDGLDFLRWQANFNMWPGGGAAKTNGDANGDGKVDGLDFLVWQAGFNR